MQLRSEAFSPNETIPRNHARDGEDHSPPLAWSDLPCDTQSLARVVLRKRALAEGIQWLELAMRLEPNRSDILYELALAQGMNKDVAGARAITMRIAQVAPNHPGLPELIRALGGAEPTSPRRAR